MEIIVKVFNFYWNWGVWYDIFFYGINIYKNVCYFYRSLILCVFVLRRKEKCDKFFSSR